MNDPVDALWQLWDGGQKPDLAGFLAGCGPLPPAELVRVVLVDQRQRWQTGDHVRAEVYFDQFPDLQTAPDLAVDLIFREFLLREKLGQAPQLDEYVARFPAHADELKDQIMLHQALASEHTAFGESDGTLAGTTISRANTQRGPSGRLSGMFGRYRIDKLLGQGGMGAVYLAWDTQLRRAVALKVPHVDDAAQGRRFMREARAAAALDHPNICQIYDFGEIGGRCFITMAYIEGESLAARLKRERPAVADTVALIHTVAGALELAHHHGLIHRDLKPANILCNRAGQPIVTDFGLVKRLSTPDRDASGTLTQEGSFCGTPAYMAPEQVNGEMAAIGPATDVYSLGIVLYEMLAGKPPFEGPLGSLLARITTEPPEPPRRRRPDLDPRLERVCLKTLAKKPADRYPTMAAFAAALDDWEKGDPPVLWFRRPALVAAATAAVALILSMAILLAWRPWKSKSHNNEVVAQPVARDPEAALARASRAWKLNDQGDPDGAILEADAALKLDDRCVPALLCKANALIKKEKFDLAIEPLDAAIRIEPNNPTPYIDRAWMLNRKGRPDLALKDADQALKLKADSHEAYYQRGAARLSLGLHAEAVADFSRAVEIKPDFIWAYRERAAAYRKLGDATKAEQDLARVAKIDGFAPGNRWVGKFDFVGMDYNSDVTLKVTERKDDTFRGIYTTEGGKWIWEVDGTVRDGDVEWKFTKVIHEDAPRDVVGNATVKGTVRNTEMTAVFRHRVYKSEAKLIMRLQP